MTVMGDKPYLEKKKFSQLRNNTYLKKDKDFNGLVLFHSLEGKFVNGWRCVSHTVKFNSDLSIRLKSWHEDCTTYEITTWYQDCYTWLEIGELSNGDIVQMEFIEDCGSVYTETEYCEECVWVDDGNGDGSTGGYSPPVVDAHDLKQNSKADCIYQKLINGKVINNFMKRYFGVTEPSHSLLGEIDLHWTIGDLSVYDTDEVETLGITRPIGSPSNPNYFVEITLDATQISKNSISAIAYAMLHEAAHAKLIAEYYDGVGTTDYKTLFIKHKNLYGADAQHLEMSLNSYINELAIGVKEFDEMIGINRSLLFYQRAISYQLRKQLKLNQGSEGYDELNQLFDNSPKSCE